MYLSNRNAPLSGILPVSSNAEKIVLILYSPETTLLRHHLRRRSGKTFLIFLFLSCLCQSLRAQIEFSQPRVKRNFVPGYAARFWDVESNLPQSNISGITQDAYGFIWISTFGGVMRYDGYFTKVFDRSVLRQTSSDFFLDIYSDSNRVFAFSSDEILVFDKSFQKVIPYPETVKQIVNVKKFGRKMLIYSDDYVFELKGNNFEEKFHAPSGKILYIAEHRDGIIINTLERWGENKVYFKPHNAAAYRIDFPFPFHVFNKTRSGTYLLRGNRGYSICSFDGQAISTIKTVHNSEIDRFFFIAGNENDYVISREDSSFIHVQNHQLAFSNEAFNYSRIRTCFVDQSGNLWLGTMANGLVCIEKQLFKNNTNASETHKKQSFFIYKNHDTRVISHDCDELEVQHKGRQFHLKTNVCFWSVCTLSEDSLLGLANDGRIYKVDLVSRQVALLADIGFYGRSVYRTKQGRILLTGGNTLFEYQHGKLQELRTFTACENLNTFFESANGNLYITSNNGIFKLDDSKRKPVLLAHIMPGLDVRCINEFEPGKFWVGTSGMGLFNFNESTNEHLRIRLSAPQAKNIWDIREDGFGNVYMPTNSGILKLRKMHLLKSVNGHFPLTDYEIFTVKDGLPSSEFNSRTQNKFFRDSDDNLYFSTVQGVTWINAFRNRRMPHTHFLFISEATINEKVTPIHNKTISFENDNQKIEFSVLAPNTNHHFVQVFRYRISGLHDTWHDLDKTRTISTENLSPGRYKLIVKASIGEAYDYVYIEVKPRLFETFWFRFIMILLVLKVIFALFYFYSINKQRQLDLANQMHELEIQTLYSQIKPHFIFNALNSIQGLFLTKQTDKANLYMSNFSSLLRQTIDIKKMSEITVREEIRFIEKFVFQEQLLFEEPFEAVIQEYFTSDPDQLLVPALISQIFVENAIKHGFNDHEKGRLKIIFEEHENDLGIYIANNGKPFKHNGSHFERHSKASGLGIVEDRVDLLNRLGRFRIAIDYNYTEDERFANFTTVIRITLNKKQK